MKENELRQAIIDYGKKLVEYHLIQSTWGNISVRLDDEYFLITPSGVNYDAIKLEDIVKIKIEDCSYESKIKPSSEKNMHQLIYKERKDIGALVHTHSSNIQVLAGCHLGLTNNGIDYPCAKYGISSTKKLAENVALIMKDYDGAIMANHGIVVSGKNLTEAFKNALEAEEAAGEALNI